MIVHLTSLRIYLLILTYSLPIPLGGPSARGTRPYINIYGLSSVTAARTYDATSDKKLKGLETVLVDHDVSLAFHVLGFQMP